MRPALSLEIERGARVFFPEAFPFFFLGAKAPVTPQIGPIPSPVKASFFGHKNTLPQNPHSQRVWEGVKFPHIRKFISVYTKKHFRICGNLFPCGRNFFRRAEGENFSCPRKEISMRMKINFRAHENIFLCARKFCALPTEGNFLSEGSGFPWARKDAARGRGWQREAKDLYLGGTPRGASSPL